jgi:hypothetical protein
MLEFSGALYQVATITKHYTMSCFAPPPPPPDGDGHISPEDLCCSLSRVPFACPSNKNTLYLPFLLHPCPPLLAPPPLLPFRTDGDGHISPEDLCCSLSRVSIACPSGCVLRPRGEVVAQLITRLNVDGLRCEGWGGGGCLGKILMKGGCCSMYICCARAGLAARPLAEASSQWRVPRASVLTQELQLGDVC